jgi:hypothetical protein
MLGRQKADLVVECDACGVILETNTGNFEAAIRFMLIESWRPRKIGYEWQHFCQRCNPDKEPT